MLVAVIRSLDLAVPNNFGRLYLAGQPLINQIQDGLYIARQDRHRRLLAQREAGDAAAAAREHPALQRVLGGPGRAEGAGRREAEQRHDEEPARVRGGQVRRGLRRREHAQAADDHSQVRAQERAVRPAPRGSSRSQRTRQNLP